MQESRQKFVKRKYFLGAVAFVFLNLVIRFWRTEQRFDVIFIIVSLALTGVFILTEYLNRNKGVHVTKWKGVSSTAWLALGIGIVGVLFLNYISFCRSEFINKQSPSWCAPQSWFDKKINKYVTDSSYLS